MVKQTRSRVLLGGEQAESVAGGMPGAHPGLVCELRSLPELFSSSLSAEQTVRAQPNYRMLDQGVRDIPLRGVVTTRATCRSVTCWMGTWRLG